MTDEEVFESIFGTVEQLWDSYERDVERNGGNL